MFFPNPEECVKTLSLLMPRQRQAFEARIGNREIVTPFGLVGTKLGIKSPSAQLLVRRGLRRLKAAGCNAQSWADLLQVTFRDS